MADYSTMDLGSSITMDYTRGSPTCTVLLSDFANMLKAFVGSNYLTVAYAFTQSGLVPGIILLIIIASITDHCCHLIVKCKYAAIRHVMDKHTDILRNGEDDDDVDENKDLPASEVSAEFAAMRQKMVRNMTYGDVGRLAFGGPGLLVVNICLMFTQFGFCVGYFIFLGNTMYHLFPYKNSTIDYNVNSSSLTSSSSNVSPLSIITDSNDVHYGNDTLLSNIVERSVTASAHFIDDLANFTSTASSSLMELLSNSSDITTAATNISNTTTATTMAPATLNTTTTMFTTTMTTLRPESIISHFVSISEAPDLRLLVITPLPIFIGFAFLRDIRHLGFVSVAADFAIFIGCVVTLAILNIGFEASETWEMYTWMKIPVFFGMVTSSFEGIGTIIPIESSMEGNRHNFSRFLHGAVFIMTILLLLFGILGYLRYGDETDQMINKNMPDGTFGVLINVCLCIGVVLTFPLQIYPVIELSEIYLFGNDRLCGPSTRRHRRLSEKVNNDEDEDDSDDEETLLSRRRHADSGDVAMTISDEVSTWKRNLLRVLLVVAAGGMAIVLRDLYAYVSAFIGAVGSSVLAYILPCMFHLKLCWSTSPRGIKAKNFIIIIFGIVASLFSLYSTIKEVIEKVD